MYLEKAISSQLNILEQSIAKKVYILYYYQFACCYCLIILISSYFI